MKVLQTLLPMLCFVVVTATSEDLKDEYEETGNGVMNTLERDPKYSHFFNGSYAVEDVLAELLNNRSLTKSSKKR